MALVLFLVTFAVYVRTLAPSVTWMNEGADSGDLVTAIFTGGIPHPPGYPLYTTLATLWISIPLGGIAYRVNLLSAFAAAAAVVALYATLSAFLVAGQRWMSTVAAATALFFGFSPLFWSQATLAGVYALNALLVIVTLGGVIAWSRALDAGETRPRFWEWFVAISLGLGLAHHLTILFLIPASLFLLGGRVRWRVLLQTLSVAILIAVGIDLILFLRAWGNPPIAWGDPRSLESWLWLISGQAYRGYIFGLPLGEYPGRLAVWARMLLEQYGIIGVALGLWGAFLLMQGSRRMGGMVLVLFGLYSLFAIGYNSRNSDAYLIPAYFAFSFWIAVALFEIVTALDRWLGRSVSIQSLRTPLLVFALFLLPLANLIGNYAARDLSQDTEAVDYAKRVFQQIPDNAIVIAEGDKHIFALWYYRYVERPSSRVGIVAQGLTVYPWYREQLKRQFSDWNWPESSISDPSGFLKRLTVLNLGQRSIFWTDPATDFRNVIQFRPVGQLFEVLSVAP